MDIAHTPIPLPGEEVPDITELDVTRFCMLVNQGIEAWAKAGNLLVQMVERNPNTYKLIMQANPHVSVDLLIAFERIGRRKVFPYLLMDKSPGAQRLLNFPYSEQERLFHNPAVKFVITVTGGKHKTTEKSVLQMSARECDQVMIAEASGYRLRTPDEQSHWLRVSDSPKPRKRSTSASRGNATSNRTGNLRSMGTYQIVLGVDGSPSLKKVDSSDFPFALPIEIIGDGESEPFEILRP